MSVGVTEENFNEEIYISCIDEHSFVGIAHQDFSNSQLFFFFQLFQLSTLPSKMNEECSSSVTSIYYDEITLESYPFNQDACNAQDYPMCYLRFILHFMKFFYMYKSFHFIR